MSRTALLVRAADLANGWIEAVNGIIGRRAGLVASTAGLGAGAAVVALGGLGAIARGFGAAGDGKQITGRHLHIGRLVGTGLGDSTGSQRKGRPRSDVADEHFDGLSGSLGDWYFLTLGWSDGDNRCSVRL